MSKKRGGGDTGAAATADRMIDILLTYPAALLFALGSCEPITEDILLLSFL